MDPRQEAQDSLDRSRTLWRTCMLRAKESRGFDSLEVSARLLESASLRRQCIMYYKQKLADIDAVARAEERVIAIRGAEVTEGTNGQMTMLCALKEA